MSAIYNLNGDWDFIFDTTNVGIDQRWYANPPETEMVANVPSTWEKQYGKYSGSIGFYFRKFTIDETFNVKRTFLRFYGSSFHTTIWLNGKIIGTNQGSYNRFDINIAKAIKSDEENLLCVRVATAAANRIEGTPILDLPVGTAYHNIPFGGIWNDVELINGGKSCILEANVIGDGDCGKFDIELRFSNPRNHSNKLLFILKAPNGELSKFERDIKLEKEDTTIKIPLQVKEFDLWSPETPNMYKLQVCLEKSYPVERNFAFRKFDIYRNEFYLNDAPIRVQGIVYGQTDPLNGVFNLESKLLKKDLKNLKELGFNAIRSGGAPLASAALKLCDELGILVFQDLPAQKQRSSKDGLELSRDLISDLITQSKTHPSLVVWVLGSDNGTLMLENGTKLLKHVDQFDDSRAVLSNMNNLSVDSDGKYKNDTGKVMGVTNDKVLLYNSHRLGLPGFLNEDESTLFSNYLQEGTDNAVTDNVGFEKEFANNYQTILRQSSNVKVMAQIDNPTLLPDLTVIPKKYTTAARNLAHGKKVNLLSKSWVETSKSLIEWGVWKDEASLRTNMNDVSVNQISNWIDTLMSSSQVTGYFLSRYRDQANHFYGLLDEFRNAKGGVEALKRQTQKDRLLISGLPKVISTEAEFKPRLRWLNVSRVGNVSLNVQILDGKGKTVQKSDTAFETVGAVFSFTGLKYKEIKEGEYTIKVTLSKDKKELDTIEKSFAVQAPAKDSKVALTNISSELSDALGAKGVVQIDSSLSLSASELEQVKVAVEGGASLLLSELNGAAAEKLAAAGILPQGTTAFPSSRDFHFYKKHAVFNDFGKGGVVDSSFESLSPRYSVAGDFEDALAQSLSVYDDYFELGTDLVLFKLGKGKVVVNQFALSTNGEDPRTKTLLNKVLGLF
jgi:beta-galactosidase